MARSITGEVAIVTGASSGIGAALAFRVGAALLAGRDAPGVRKRADKQERSAHHAGVPYD